MTPGAGTPLIEVRGVTKRYSRDVLALDSISFSLMPGVIGLVGANGAGKSTLLKILLGLLEPTAGEARVLGFDVRRQGPTLRQYLGYMPEDDCLPHDVDATNFVTHMAQVSGLPRADARDRASEALRHVGLFEERYRQMSGYSTGMKQRVKLAQALVHDPRLMLLDEPTSGLDPSGRTEMLELIRRIGRDFGIAIMMSSHLLGEIEQVCDHVLVIDAGQLMRSDSIAAFTSETAVLLVEVSGDANAAAARLTELGLAPAVDGPTIAVELRAGVHDLVRDTLAEMGLGLVRMQQRRHRLEEIFARDGHPS